MATLKIGIVEDDLIIAAAVSEMLQDSGYEVTEPATRYSEALAMIETELPDLLLIDVNILGKLDGIAVGRAVRSAFNIPFIFLTANTDADTISRAKEVMPSAFLAKPISHAQLFAAIEIAAATWNTTHSIRKGQTLKPADNFLLVKDGYGLRRVPCNEILFAESEQNYIRLVLTDGTKPLIRSTIAQFEERAAACGLLRVHRSYLVQLSMIKKVLPHEVIVGEHHIPVSRAYREALNEAFGI